MSRDADRVANRRIELLIGLFVAAMVPGLTWLAGVGSGGSIGLILAVGALMLLAEAFPVDLELRHESHSFSFSKVPIVVGIFLLPPLAVIAARIVTSLIVLAGVHRQRPLKLAVNLIAHTLEVMVAACVVVWWRPPGDFGWRSWFVAVLAVVSADLI